MPDATRMLIEYELHIQRSRGWGQAGYAIEAELRPMIHALERMVREDAAKEAVA